MGLAQLWGGWQPWSLQRAEGTQPTGPNPSRKPWALGPCLTTELPCPPALPPRMLGTLPFWVLLPGSGCNQPHLHSQWLFWALSSALRHRELSVPCGQQSQKAHAHGSAAAPEAPCCGRTSLFPDSRGLGSRLCSANTARVPKACRPGLCAGLRGPEGYEDRSTAHLDRR